MNLRTILAASAVVCAWGAAGAAHAFDDQKYVGLMGLYYLPDNSFHLDDGGGARGYFGIPLNPNLNLEFNAFGYGADPKDSSLPYVKQYGAGIDLMAPLTHGSKFTPFVILGGGYDRAEAGGSRFNNGFGNAGLGGLLDLGGGWALRAEARYVALFADKDLPENRYDDAVFGLGFQYQFHKPAPPPPPPAAIPPPPPPPKDTDGDGVLDTVDQCPNTPRGVQVDVRGCPLDSDGDGVPDYLDKCPNTPRGLRVDATGCVSEAQTIVLQNVNFEFNKATLTAPAQDVLRGVAKGLVSQPSMRVEIAGHTDSKGSDAYNQKLSERRAASVRTFLIGQGVASAQLTSKGYGEKQPVAPNTTDDGRAQNRRVEFRVLKK